MGQENDGLFTADDADRLEQQAEVSDEATEEEDEPFETAVREANEADVAEQARSVSGDEDYPRGPVEDERA